MGAQDERARRKHRRHLIVRVFNKAFTISPHKKCMTDSLARTFLRRQSPHPFQLDTSPFGLFIVLATIWVLAAILNNWLWGNIAPEQYFFFTQDLPVLALTLSAVALFRNANSATAIVSVPGRNILFLLIAFVVLLGWAGHYAVFSGYALSRDEDLARMTVAHLREGLLGMPIPVEWRPYHAAIVPEYLSAVGADRYWIAQYLPGSAGFETLVSFIGDPALANPLLLGQGLLALRHNSGKLFPGRLDAQWIVMLMALTSSQLLVASMTSYAMTAHFAVNMIWLALFLRNDRKGHFGAIVVGAIALGLHKVVLHVLFAGPVLATLIWQKRWKTAAAYAGAYILFLLFWMKLYPLILMGVLDLDMFSTVMSPLPFERLGTFNPLVYISRFAAWNNILMLPLSVAGLFLIVRKLWGEASHSDYLIMFGLAVGCGIGLCLTPLQGLGWGYRYLQGFIGSFCLLAGFGWAHLSRKGHISMRFVRLITGVTIIVMAVQMTMAYRFSQPYVRAYHAARALPADVVLVDAQTAVYGADIVRLTEGRIVRPVLLDMGMLDIGQIRTLCRTRKIALFDKRSFKQAGVLTSLPAQDGGRISRLRRELIRLKCGAQIPVRAIKTAETNIR